MTALKKIAMGGSAIVLAIAMGLQTFVFGQNDLQALKDEVVKLSERMAKLEAPKAHE
jgi:thymidine phosphorylase